MQEGFIEGYIEKEIEKIWDAYLSVDVKTKTGYEKVPELLSKLLADTIPYWGLKDFFEANTAKEVYITDDVLHFNDQHEAKNVLDVINGKEVLVRIRVNIDSEEQVNTYFKEALQDNLNPLWILLHWLSQDDGFLLQIRKRRKLVEDSFLRLYPDGTGAVITLGDQNKYEIFYFQLSDHILKNIKEKVETKVDYIISHMECVHEDDREYGYSVALKYGLLWKYPDAEERLKSGHVYEDKDYSNDEFKIKLANQILSIPSIRENWMSGNNDEQS